MRKAYDIILQSEVSAVLAAQSGGFEQYRYECASCGEEVYIAAPYSTRRVAHFRHRSGNNDVECENYLGQYGIMSTDSRSRRNNRERVEFYFNSSNKTFSLGLRFSANEIQEFEKRNVDFEIRSVDSEVPFYTLPINSTHFAPDVPTLISLSNFSYSYSLSNTLSGTKRKYEFFKPGSIPIFFKVQGNDSDFKAKLVRSDVLYTNVLYFVAFRSQYSTPQGIRRPDEILVTEKFRFETMGSKFLGMTLSIKTKTAHIDALLKSWGYQLETSEKLTLLWPPAPIIDDVSVITSEDAFVFTSFDLQAHGNINVPSTDIFMVGKGISKIVVKPKTKILKKNAEIIIDKFKYLPDYYDDLVPSESTTNIFIVPDNGFYYVYNSISGVAPLKTGQLVFLTPKSVVMQYDINYPIRYIYPCRQKECADKELLEDILMHYKRTEVLDIDLFRNLSLSEISSRYIDKCKGSTSINSVAKRYILEGLL